MAASQTGILRILDCSKGLSDWYPPRLEDNQLAQAWDVEFWDGSVCGRRNGSLLKVGGPADIISHSLFVHTPTTLRADDRLAHAYRYIDGVYYVSLYDQAWGGTFVTNPYVVMNFAQGVDWASLHGKLFIATKSNVNRLLVYTPSLAAIRPTGLRPLQIVPTATNVPGTQTYFDARQFRVRLTRQIAGVTLLRSEPTVAVPFVPPPGNSVAAQIGIDASGSDAWATHWELEEISGGAWYRINTIPLATVAINTAISLTQVASLGILSEDIGDYTLQYSARFLTVDEDRLLLGGSFDEESKSARVSWTPIGASGSEGGQVGVGNDERLPTDVNGFLDFDTLDGGGLTGLKAWEGKVIVFKRSQVHSMVRSSSRLRAYLPDTLSRRHGAIPYSIVEGTDVDGLSCLYFLDPEVGPMQLGFKGLRVLAPEMQRTWRANINLDATVIANVTYHAEKRQVWWQIATGTNPAPNVRWMYSVESDGLVFHTLPAPTKSATLWLQKPTLCYDTTATFVTLIAQGDQTTMVVDLNDDYRYRAFVRTKAYQLGQLLRRFQIDSAILEVNARIGAVVHIKCVRDFGQEERSVAVLTTPPALVDLIAIPVDNSYMTEALTMQFELGDITPLNALDIGGWQVHGLTLAWSLGSPSTGRG
jgi:hypothetical protein